MKGMFKKMLPNTANYCVQDKAVQTSCKLCGTDKLHILLTHIYIYIVHLINNSYGKIWKPLEMHGREASPLSVPSN